MKYDLCGESEVKISPFGDVSNMMYCTMVLYLYVCRRKTHEKNVCMYIYFVQVEIFVEYE